MSIFTRRWVWLARPVCSTTSRWLPCGGPSARPWWPVRRSTRRPRRMRSLSGWLAGGMPGHRRMRLACSPSCASGSRRSSRRLVCCRIPRRRPSGRKCARQCSKRSGTATFRGCRCMPVSRLATQNRPARRRRPRRGARLPLPGRPWRPRCWAARRQGRTQTRQNRLLLPT